MHVNHIHKLKEVRHVRLHKGFLDRFYSPYIFVIWIISCSNYGIPYMTTDISFIIQIAYSVLASAYHTNRHKKEWDRDMHVLENNNTNLTWLLFVDFICTCLSSFVSIMFLCGIYEAYLPIVAISLWVGAFISTCALHVFLHYYYRSVIRSTMRSYDSISEKI